jgi:hypothetical protein
MSTITAILDADDDGTLHLPLPPELRSQRIRVTAQLEPLAADSRKIPSQSAEALRGFGCLRGKLWISPNFNEPLDEFEDYMG